MAAFKDFDRLDSKYINTGDLALTSTWYRTIFIGPTQFYTSYASTNSTSGMAMVTPSSNIANAGVALWAMTTASTAASYFSFQLPNDYSEGSTFIPYIHWTVSGSTASSAYTTLGMVYTLKDLGSSASSYATQATALQLATTGTTAYTIHTTNFAAINSTCSVGAIFNGGLYIDTTIANSTYAGTMYIQGLSFTYKIDGLGSTYATQGDK